MRRLLFVSPRFLFPSDSGGKIRTAQILRGMRAGSFDVTLVSPVPRGGFDGHRGALDEVCHRFEGWPSAEPSRLRRGLQLASRLPVSVASDRSAAGRHVVARELEKSPDVVVFDFLHSVVLAPKTITPPALLFTHNVESWLFRRHREVARNPLLRLVWRAQWRKMDRFERRALARFDTVVAVSTNDAEWFRDACGFRNVQVVPTGVDLGFFEYSPPVAENSVVFTGSMDWLANQDAVEYLLREIWPLIARERPEARMSVIGRDPPRSLVQRANGLPWTFTGYVDDVRPYVRDGSVCVIPLRVGGGTRIKVFEAMAMGRPIVSTSIGVEGLPVVDGEHFLRADTEIEFARAVVKLLSDHALRTRLARDARRLVERNFSASRAASVFATICSETIAAVRR